MTAADGGKYHALVIGLDAVLLLYHEKLAKQRGACVDMQEDIVIGGAVSDMLLHVLAHTRERLFYGRTMYNPQSRFIGEIDAEYKNEEAPKPKEKPKSEYGEKTRKIRVSNELFSRSAISANVGKTQSSGVTFRAGDRVKHMTFGEGTVLSAKAMGADILYEIAFDNVGTKKLMATYAKLTKV